MTSSKRRSRICCRQDKKRAAVSAYPVEVEKKSLDSSSPFSLSLGSSGESSDNEKFSELMPRDSDSEKDNNQSVDSSRSSSFSDEFASDATSDSETDEDGNDDNASTSSVDTKGTQSTSDSIIEATNDLSDLEDILFMQRSLLHVHNDRWDHKRMSWDNHVAQLEHKGLFSNEYMMTRPTHEKLVSIVTPYQQRAEYDSRCSEPILVDHIVAVGIRVLSGGRTKDQCHITRMSIDAAYKVADDFIDAVNAAPEFDICMPKTDNEWEEINRGFKKKSTN